MGSPLLSVFVLNYNYARYLPQCIQPILDQTFRDFELVIIDDRSKDNSLEVIRPYLADPRVRLVANDPNLGFCKSLIAGTEVHTKGEFVTVISADDHVSRPDAFATQIGLLQAHPQAAYAFSAIELVRGDKIEAVHHSFPGETTLDSRAALEALLTLGTVWPLHSGTIMRRSAYLAAGGYRRDLKMVLDLQIWLAMAMHGGFTYTPAPLYGYRMHDSQMSVVMSGIRQNAREVGSVLREACLEGERRGFGTAHLMRESIGTHLANTAMSEAFTGSPAVARRRWLAATLEWPVQTLTSRKLWIVAARAALGARATDYLRVVDQQRQKLTRRFYKGPPPA